MRSRKELADAIRILSMDAVDKAKSAACINRIWRRFRVSPFLVRAASRGNGKARLLVFAVAFFSSLYEIHFVI